MKSRTSQCAAPSEGPVRREGRAVERLFCQRILCSLTLLFLVGACSGVQSSNILLYVIDTLRADHLATYGYGRNTSPNLEALARDGVVFRRAYAQSSWTKPTVASLLTGRHPLAHRVIGTRSALPDGERTLAEILQDAGYETAAISTNRFVSKKFGFAQGFGTFSRVGDMGDIASDQLVDGALEWLEHRSEGGGFYLYLQSTDSHPPYTPPAAALEELGVTVRDWRLAETGVRNALGPAASMEQERLLSVTKDLEALYDAEIAVNDKQFGRLIKALKSKSLYKSTLIVVVGDHGEEFYDHGRLGHGDSLYIEQLWVPLIIKFPGHWQQGRQVDEVAQQLDILPTLLDYLALPIPESVEGKSLMPLLRSKRYKPAERPAFAHLHAKHGKRYESVIWRRFHLIRGRDDAKEDIRTELYDLETDFLERTNIAGREPETVHELTRLLDRAAARRQQVSAGRTVDLDEETLETLRAMGYIGSEGDADRP